MKILLTNDDGIDSPFLLSVAEAFAEAHELVVAAPSQEQSWIGKAMSRRGTVSMEERQNYPCPAFSLEGTPSDCVNIALGHLCPERPDLVLSGINIGHNAGLSFVASSGTIGGAMEAALQDIPAIAASMYLEPDRFQSACNRKEPLPQDLQEHLNHAASTLEDFARGLIQNHAPRYGQVHSLNFPNSNLDQATIEPVPAAQTLSHCLFDREPNGFRFRYQPLEVLDPAGAATDRNLVHKGMITHTLIDFNALHRAP